MRLRLLIVLLVLLLSVSCVQFPSKQLSLDVSSQSTPVMLTETPIKGDSIPLSFESGYNSVSVTSTRSYGGVSTSSTATSASDINRPLGEQLNVAFIQSPQYLVVSALTLQTDRLESFWMSTKKYLLSLQILAPKAAKQGEKQ